MIIEKPNVINSAEIIAITIFFILKPIINFLEDVLSNLYVDSSVSRSSAISILVDLRSSSFRNSSMSWAVKTLLSTALLNLSCSFITRSLSRPLSLSKTINSSSFCSSESSAWSSFSKRLNSSSNLFLFFKPQLLYNLFRTRY